MEIIVYQEGQPSHYNIFGIQDALNCGAIPTSDITDDEVDVNWCNYHQSFDFSNANKDKVREILIGEEIDAWSAPIDFDLLTWAGLVVNTEQDGSVLRNIIR